MHDPMTIAFEIRYPWRERRTSPYRAPFITIWHRDPEKDGDDDSCGFSYVTLSKADREWAEKRAAEEWKYWFSEEFACINFRPTGDLEVLAAVWSEARHRADGVRRNKMLRPWDIAQVFRLMACSGDNLGHLVAAAKQDEEEFTRLFACVLRIYRTARRPWFLRPRWHVHHWRIQCHPLRDFKRWAFSRCERCGSRFRWGYAPCTGQWNGRGPQWFRGEPGVYHQECHGRR